MNAPVPATTTQVDHCTIWAFLLWGQHTLPDLIEAVEDPDFQMCLDHAFFELTKLFDMWDHLMAFDRHRRACEPHRPEAAAPLVSHDQRRVHDREPLASLFHAHRSLLQPVALPVLDWPMQPGVPLVTGFHENPTLFVLHMFSGRRRVQDCHDLCTFLTSCCFYVHGHRCGCPTGRFICRPRSESSEGACRRETFWIEHDGSSL